MPKNRLPQKPIKDRVLCQLSLTNPGEQPRMEMLPHISLLKWVKVTWTNSNLPDIATVAKTLQQIIRNSSILKPHYISFVAVKPQVKMWQAKGDRKTKFTEIQLNNAKPFYCPGESWNQRHKDKVNRRYWKNKKAAMKSQRKVFLSHFDSELQHNSPNQVEI